MSYSREHPSPRYEALIAQYVKLHSEGDKMRHESAERVYAGKRVLGFAPEIKQWIKKFDARTLLDYGSGKGCFYLGSPYFGIETKNANIKKYGSLNAYWEVDRIVCYDPAFPSFGDRPEGTFDGVICIDVLEHCPEEDLPWIIDELFTFAEKFVFATVALSPALRNLPSGENAHCTLNPIAWWEACFRQAETKIQKAREKKVHWSLIFEAFSLENSEWKREKETSTLSNIN